MQLAFAHRAVAYMKADKLTKALADLNKAISLNANDEISYYRKGFVQIYNYKYVNIIK